MAGIAHLPKPIVDLLIDNQNSADARPIFRAAFRNLTKWTHGKRRETPPAARYFEGHVDGTDAFTPTTDLDGHFAGGVRLPHVESTVYERVAGAPLGRHTPVNPVPLDPPDPFVFLGGTFTRFRDEDLVTRYPSRLQYVQRVIRAADSLAAGGYITNKDRKALIAAAEVEPLPCGPEDDDGNDFGGESQCPKP